MKKYFLITCMCAALAFASCGGGAGNQQNQTGGSTGESLYDTADSTSVDTQQTSDTGGRDAGDQVQPNGQ